MINEIPLAGEFIELYFNKTPTECKKWLKKANKDYLTKKNNKTLSTDDIEQYKLLFAFIKNANEELSVSPSVMETFSKSEWAQDIEQLILKETEKTQNELYEKLDLHELSERDSLLNFIDSIGQRLMIYSTYYDYDSDSLMEASIEIPRNISEKEEKEYKSDLKYLCSSFIYNRAQFIINVFLPRGVIEKYGIGINGNGEWYPLPEKKAKEIDNQHLEVDSNPIEPVTIRYRTVKKHKTKDESNILYMHRK